MIVGHHNFQEVLSRFEEPGHYAVDTETYGFRWFGEDKLFSIILADKDDGYYFNFKDTPDHLGNFDPKENTFPRSWINLLQPIFKPQESTWFMHNAKFDMGMLSRDGLSIGGTVHCTEAVARLIHTEHRSYTLKQCLQRFAAATGQPIAKSDAVVAYILKHKLWEWIQIPGKKKRDKDMHFDLVPFDVMAPYGLDDAIGTRALGMYQRNEINTRLFAKTPKILKVAHQERALTKVLFKMEKHGYNLDKEYTENSKNRELAKIKALSKSYTTYTGQEFTDSGKQFAEIFTAAGETLTYTEKGNPSFTKDTLGAMQHPLAPVILGIRKAQKKISSYYTNFEYYATDEGTIHANFMQGGTRTGRMSVREPAMQTIPKPDTDVVMEDDLLDTSDAAEIRKCFVPPEDYCLFMPDYDQMEYRMMLDMAEEMELIEAVKAGLDVHTATAELVGVSRSHAKTINFMLLYGGGVQKLAEALGIPYVEAKNIRGRYFQKLGKIKTWIARTTNEAAQKRYIVNWMGRVVEVDPRFAYKAPNYKIQGGCADAAKKAMVDCDAIIVEKNLKSKMIGMVHDELHILLHKDELALGHDFVQRMEKAYPHKHLPLTAGPAHSWVSWGDKVESYPIPRG